DVLDAALDAVLRPDPDLDGALDGLRRQTAAAGVALLRWPGDAAVVVASSGELGPSPGRPVPSPGWRLGPVADGYLVWRRTGDVAEGLAVWGDVHPGRPGLIPIARLLHHFAPGSVAVDAGAEPPALRLPSEIVRGRSPAMEALYRQMSPLLASDVPVLVLGETGVGKEHLARALHGSGPRRGGPFVPVNCAAIPKELLEAEMFGIAKGVATGVDARRGKFSEARGGTLFLDEIGDMPMELQAKLLRVLQDGEIHPLGRAPESTDVRIVAATNTQLQQSIERRTFRGDLYYRLAGYVLEVPPLRGRAEDIPLLVAHFLRRFSREAGKPIRGVTVKALRRLAADPWPGNVRELEHEVRRLVFVCPPHHVIDAELLNRPGTAPAPADAGPEDAPNPAAAAPPATPEELPADGLEALLHDVEARAIREALRRTAGNQSAAARLLGISRNGLGKRIKRLGIDVARFLPENR
ncbi:MAG: sigma-54 dependent transcriptional regulator, partial [Acidobacteriota bacterium]